MKYLAVRFGIILVSLSTAALAWLLTFGVASADGPKPAPALPVSLPPVVPPPPPPPASPIVSQTTNSLPVQNVAQAPKLGQAPVAQPATIPSAPAPSAQAPSAPVVVQNVPKAPSPVIQSVSPLGQNSVPSAPKPTVNSPVNLPSQPPVTPATIPPITNLTHTMTEARPQASQPVQQIAQPAVAPATVAPVQNVTQVITPATAPAPRTVQQIAAPTAAAPATTQIIAPLTQPVTAAQQPTQASPIAGVAPTIPTVNQVAAPALEPAAQVLAPVTQSAARVAAPAVSPAVPLVTQGAAKPVIAPAAQALAPVTQSLAQVAVPVVSPMVQTVTQVAAPVFEPAAQTLTPVNLVVSPIIEPLAQSLAPLTRAAAPLAEPLSPVVAPLTAAEQSVPLAMSLTSVTGPQPAVVPLEPRMPAPGQSAVRIGNADSSTPLTAASAGDAQLEPAPVAFAATTASQPGASSDFSQPSTATTSARTMLPFNAAEAIHAGARSAADGIPAAVPTRFSLSSAAPLMDAMMMEAAVAQPGHVLALSPAAQTWKRAPLASEQPFDTADAIIQFVTATAVTGRVTGGSDRWVPAPVPVACLFAFAFFLAALARGQRLLPVEPVRPRFAVEIFNPPRI